MTLVARPRRLVSALIACGVACAQTHAELPALFSRQLHARANFRDVGAPFIPGDADGSGEVNVADVTSVLAPFGQPCETL